MGVNGIAMSDPSLITFVDNEAMASRLADMLEAQLARAIAENGTARLAVSGGSTPAALYKKLSQRTLDWSRVSVLLVDERWVAPGEPGSNETFVRETLMQNNAASAVLYGLWRDAITPAAAVPHLNNELAEAFPFCDAVVLGMGNDCHTASWFPHADGLETALTSKDLMTSIRAEPSEVVGKHRDRVTMTLSAVAQARFICLLLAGSSKRDAFETAQKQGPVEAAPVRAILKARQDLWTCWTA